jgi:hypothetical protein
MNYSEKLQKNIQQVQQELDKSSEELKHLEEEFANVKLNPYGITSIDFSKRQELSKDIIKMEGAIMGLTLALETFRNDQGVTAE